jgi:hypothetical protein
VYDKVLVTGVAWKIYCINCDSDTAPYVAVMTNVNAAVPNTPKNLVEDDRCKWRQLSFAGGARNTCMLKGYCDNAKLFGMTREQYEGEQNFYHDWDDNPAAAYTGYHVFTVYNNDSTSTDVQVTFDFTYYAIFTQRKAYAPS